MYATTATCVECKGEGCVEHPFLTTSAGIADECPPDDSFVDCEHCAGTGECDCDECLSTAAENAFSDQCESEPPVTLDEQHRAAWNQKQALRR